MTLAHPLGEFSPGFGTGFTFLLPIVTVHLSHDPIYSFKTEPEPQKYIWEVANNKPHKLYCVRTRDHQEAGSTGWACLSTAHQVGSANDLLILLSHPGVIIMFPRWWNSPIKTTFWTVAIVPTIILFELLNYVQIFLNIATEGPSHNDHDSWAEFPSGHWTAWAECFVRGLDLTISTFRTLWLEREFQGWGGWEVMIALISYV